MKTVQASEAKTHFLRILDQVERGETIAITRHGRQVAIITPHQDSQETRAKRAFANIMELRKRTLPMSVEEILSARDEGRS
jgi:prevent-host-death family protein